MADKFNKEYAAGLYRNKQYSALIDYCNRFPTIASALCTIGFCLVNGLGCSMDIEKGRQFLQKAANAGDSNAMAMIGQSYLYGMGVEQDEKRGLRLLKRACEQDNYTAFYYLGYYYYCDDPEKKNVAKGVKMIQQAARNGIPSAMSLCGYLIETGVLTDTHENETAPALYAQAAFAGDPNGMIRLAYCYKNGSGVPVSENNFVYWMEKAAECGDSSAMVVFAKILLMGTFVKKDERRAFRLLKAAVDQDNSDGLIQLGECYYKGKGTKKSVKDACICFEKAANLGQTEALFFLGRLLYQEQEVRNIPKAIDCFYACAENGDATAAYILGTLLELENIPYKTSPSRLYLIAANSGNPNAMLSLGNCYYFGDGGVAKDLNQAFVWYSAAANSNNAKATSLLGYCYYKGYGTKQDYDKAYECFIESPKEEISAECLGELFGNVNWNKYNLKKAKTWFKKAVKLGNKTAEKNLEIVTNWLELGVEFGTQVDSSVLYIMGIAECQEMLENTIQEMAKTIEQLVLSNATKDAEILNLKQEIVTTKKSVQANAEAIAVIKEQLARLQNDIAQHKNEVEQKLEKCATESEEESLYQHFISETAQMINQAIAASIQNSVKGIKDELVRMFGQYWSELDEYTQTSLISAKVFLSRTNDDSLDYSGIVISATSALENELEHRFHSGYQKYLRNMFGNDYSQWPRSMVYSDRTRTTWKKQFTLGSMPEIFGGETRTNDCSPAERKQKCWLYDDEKQCINEYLNTILRVPDKQGLNYFLSKANGLNYIDRCEDVRCLYRNAAAHTAPIRRDDAIDCYNYIIGHQDASEQIGAIQGLIFDLVKMTRIPK